MSQVKPIEQIKTGNVNVKTGEEEKGMGNSEIVGLNDKFDIEEYIKGLKSVVQSFKYELNVAKLRVNYLNKKIPLLEKEINKYAKANNTNMQPGLLR